MQQLEKPDVVPHRKRLFSGKRWFAFLLVMGSLLGASLLALSGFQHNVSRAAQASLPGSSGTTPTQTSQQANSLILFETYESTIIHITARSTRDGKVAWTSSHQYEHADYIARGNGISYAQAGDEIFFISKCQLNAVNATSGTVIWQKDLLQAGQTFCEYTKVLFDAEFDRIYVVGAVSTETLTEYPVNPGEQPLVQLPSTSQPRLLAFQGSTGRQLWQNTSIGVVIDGFLFTADFAVDRGIIYTTKSPIVKTADDRRLIALDGQNGQLLWQDQRPGEESMSLIAGDGIVYTLSALFSADRQSIEGFTLAGLQGTSGTPLWSHPLKTDASSPLIITQHTLVVQSFTQTAVQGTYHIQLHGYDLETGSQTLFSNIGLVQNHVPVAPTIAADSSNVYLALGGTEVEAIQLSDGKMLWKTGTFGSIGGPFQVADGHVTFLNRDAARAVFLVALEARDGSVAWQQQIG
ncbi:outer membrane protein assembly factor BamB family protein [Dictyobacter formicarum]|uniref:Pyrrolo-quinoline quinone repeat domain-containing protein n=1 Tax=Dictyobacter formicarum TaxID=2778368 RepID=A0ABQ3VBB4_9CHLR|nr:PQQ-binding-like beta-propeller repeat protein [Dictyobacter formicarum]GHO82698.1 hypothetical protein KSZ_07040 [Dictyobacter formicarum]